MTIAGNAWVDVVQMRLAGSWTSTTAWQTSITIAPGTNVITINAYNFAGAQIGTASVTIIGTGTIVPATAANLVISEIMYNPGAPTAAEITAGFTDGDAFEFLELQNISATNTISLANCVFTAGISSTALNGNPGTGDATTFTVSALGDDNGDGIVNLVQYALAGTTPYTSPFGGSDGSFLMLTFRRNLADDDTTVTVQRSTDLATWTSGLDVDYVSEAHNADGTTTYGWRSTHPLGATPSEFLRLRITKP